MDTQPRRSGRAQEPWHRRAARRSTLRVKFLQPRPPPDGYVVVALEIAVEAEGVVEVEAEGADDGRGEVLEGPATREVDVAIEAAARGGAEDARARIGHARPLAGGDDTTRRPPARAGRRTRTEGRIRPPSSP